MARKSKKVVKEVKEEVVVPTEQDNLTAEREYLLHLANELKTRKIPVPAQLDVKLGQINQRLVELGGVA